MTEEPGLGPPAVAVSENQMTAITESTWRTSSLTSPPGAPITRESSDVSLYAPVRRRSLVQTPGVATRSSPVRDSGVLPQLNLQVDDPPPFGVSRQQSFESYESGFISIPPRVQDRDAVPRVVTPCEEPYQSIGAFKLGTLRITNPSPSPVTAEVDPSRDDEGAALDSTIRENGYFSGAQGHEANVNAAEPAPTNVQSPEPSTKQTVSHTVSPGQSQPARPALQTTPQVTTLEDKPFDDEPQPEYCSVEVLDVRLDPNAKPPHSQVEREKGNTITRSDSGIGSTTSPSPKSAHQSLSKADSGYSSTVSLRSFQAKVQASEERPYRPPSDRESTVGPEERNASCQCGVRCERTPAREFRPPPVSPKNSPQRPYFSLPRPSGSFSRRSMTQDRKDSTPKAARPASASTASREAADGEPKSPQSVPRTPTSMKSPRSDDNSGTSQSNGDGAQKPNRLQRLLSGARRPTASPPTVYTAHAVEHGSIPPVPRAVETRLRERPGLLPPGARKLALKPHSSLDTLKTIFSVGSLEASFEAVNSKQNVAAEPENEGGGRLWKQTLHSMPASLANAAAHVIPRKSITRKPVSVRQEIANKGDKVPGSASGTQISAHSRKQGGRSMSLTSPREGGSSVKHRGASLDLPRSPTSLQSPALPGPIAKATSAENKATTSPPRCDTRRRPSSLRVPPSSRPQSFPSVSRRASRESVRSRLPTQPLTAKVSTSSSRNTSNRPGTADGPVHPRSPGAVGMDPRRLQSFRQSRSPPSSACVSPKWQAQTHGETTGRASRAFVTPGSSRRNSISSVQSEGFYGSAQRWPQQPLRHRASFDGDSHNYHHHQHQHHHQRPHPRHGYAPSMSTGYTTPSYSHSSTSTSSNHAYGYDYGYHRRSEGGAGGQLGAAAGQWYHDGGRYPPPRPPPSYIPRAGGSHSRNYSGYGGYGPQPPYRVLHSYNSPAYRNAPIWG